MISVLIMSLMLLSPAVFAQNGDISFDYPVSESYYERADNGYYQNSDMQYNSDAHDQTQTEDSETYYQTTWE
jgi:hypothetical protein